MLSSFSCFRLHCLPISLVQQRLKNRITLSILSCLLISFSGCQPDSESQSLFGERPSGDLPSQGKTYGASVLNLNDDNLPDLVLSTHGQAVSSFINTGADGFRLIQTNSDQPKFSDLHGIASCDFNGDGLLDLYLTAGAEHGNDWGINQLWVGAKTGWQFNENTEPTLLSDDVGRGRGALWADLNSDASPDLLVLNYRSPIRLLGYDDKRWQDFTSLLPVVREYAYWSKQKKTPTDIERSASVWSHGASVGDFNSDGLADLVVLGRLGASGLWLNRPNATLADVTSQYGLKPALWPHLPIHSAVGDLNGDGALDLIFVYKPDENVRPRRNPVEVHLNNGGKFSKQSTETSTTGVPADTDPQCCIVADLNNDGHLDIYVVVKNGGNQDSGNLVLQGKGDGTFTSVGDIWGGLGPRHAARESAVICDLDLDGDLDIITLNGGSDDPEANRGAVVYENQSVANRGVTIELVDRSGTPHGLGARVYYKNQTREVVSVATPFSSSILPVHFGLGAHEGPVEINIFWPEPGGEHHEQKVILPATGAAYRVIKGVEKCVTLSS
jgi:hypothetical protein